MNMTNIAPCAAALLALPLTLVPVACGGDGGPPPDPTADLPDGGGETSGDTGGSAGGPGAAAADLRVDPARPGTLFGAVTYDGEPPRMRTVGAGNEPGCGHHDTPPLQQDWVVADGKVANAVVWLHKRPADLASAPAPETSATLDQRGCLYAPHMLAMRVGQTLQVLNSDETNHNVNVQARKNASSNTNCQRGSEPLEMVFQKEEVAVPFSCDIHPWMGASVAVFEHSFFAVSGADGTWAIEGLTPGTYEVRLWHEKGGLKRQRNIALTPEGGVEVPFALKGR